MLTQMVCHFIELIVDLLNKLKEEGVEIHAVLLEEVQGAPLIAY